MAAHKPAIIERKGVKVGFLQYTARCYQDAEQIAAETEAGVSGNFRNVTELER